MNLNINFIKVGCLIFCCILLSSCLSINRSIKLNKDGSGSEVLSITFDKQFYQAIASMATFMDSSRRTGFLDSLYSDEIFVNKTKDQYDTISGIKMIDISSQRGADSSNSFIVKYEFDSIQKISYSLDQMNNNQDSSITIVTLADEGANVVFNYSYTQPAAEVLSDSLSEEMNNGLASIFGNDFIKFEIEFPYEVISSNSASANGNLLTWNYSISDIIIKKEMKLEAVMRKE